METPTLQQKPDFGSHFPDFKIPTLPLVAQKLVDLCQDENADFAKFAQVIESDPGLSWRFLRVANSAYYGMAQKVTTLPHAISLLGLKYTKSIALGFHLINTLDLSDPKLFDLQDFWKQSITRALIGRNLAQHACPEFREEAFLIGLLQDCGIPVLVEHYGEPYAKLWNEYKTSPAALFELERQVFEYDHIKAAMIIAEKWNIPEQLSQPIFNHHTRSYFKLSSSSAVRLCQIAYVTGNLSFHQPDTFCEEDFTLLHYMKNVLSMTTADVNQIFEQARQEFAGIMDLFSEVLPGEINAVNLLLDAKALLCEMEEESRQKLIDYEAEIQKLRSSLKHMMVPREDQPHYLPKDELTGLISRAGLLQFLEITCQNTHDGQISLTVMFMDLDNFKAINDRYGHVVGDQYLKDFARCLRDSFRETDCVARYGGDEFVVVLRGLDPTQAMQTGLKTLQNVNHQHPDLDYQNLEDVKTFSCSIGLLHCGAGADIHSASEAIELADKLMYQAKQEGKKRISWKMLDPEPPAA